jgi:hypothetical protein
MQTILLIYFEFLCRFFVMIATLPVPNSAKPENKYWNIREY